MVVLDDHIVLMTESGTWIASYNEAHCLLRPHGIISHGKYTAGTQLQIDGGDDYVIALGFGGFGSVFQINSLSVTEFSSRFGNCKRYVDW